MLSSRNRNVHCILNHCGLVLATIRAIGVQYQRMFTPTVRVRLTLCVNLADIGASGGKKWNDSVFWVHGEVAWRTDGHSSEDSINI